MAANLIPVTADGGFAQTSSGGQPPVSFVNETQVNTAISDVVGNAPSNLNTLKELADELANKANTSSLSSVATSGSYTDLTNQPTIPTVPTTVSSFTNDAGYLTSVGTISYNDLTNKPTIPSLTGYATESYVGTAIANLVDTAPTTLNTLNELAAALGDDANYATTISTALGNKADTASLSTVATSGSYTDLSNTPSIPTVPSTVSSFTNDAGYLTSVGSISYNDLTDTPTIPTSFTSIVNGSYSVSLASTGTLTLPISPDTTATWTSSNSDFLGTGGTGYNDGGCVLNGGGSVTGRISIRLTDPTKIATWLALPSGTGVSISGTGYMPFGSITLTLTGVSGQDGAFYYQEFSQAGVIYQDGYSIIDSVSFSKAGTGITVTPSALTFPDDTQQTTAWTGSVSYDDLTNKPTLFSGSYTDLSDKPTLFSGSYTDLSDKPTIPTNYFKGLQILEDVYEASGAANIIFSSTDNSVTITRNANNIDFSASSGGSAFDGTLSIAGSAGSTVTSTDGTAILDLMGWSRIGNTPGHFDWDQPYKIYIGFDSGSEAVALKNKFLSLTAGAVFDFTYTHPDAVGSWLQFTFNDLTLSSVVDNGGGNIVVTVEENLYTLLQAYFDSGAASPTGNVTYTAQIVYNRVMAVTTAGTPTKTWTFTNDGVLTLPASGDIVDSTGTSVLGGAASYNDLTNKPTIPADIGDLTDTGNLLISTTTTNISWSSVDSGNITFYADQSTSQISITQVSSSSNGTSLDIYNALAAGTFVSGNSGTLVEVGDNTVGFVLTSGFTYDANAGGGGGGWVANATATSGTPTATTGSSAVFVTGGISYNDLTNKPTIPTNYFKGLQILEDVYTASGAANIIFESTDNSVSITRNANALDFTVAGGGSAFTGTLEVPAGTTFTSPAEFNGSASYWNSMMGNELRIHVLGDFGTTSNAMDALDTLGAGDSLVIEDGSGNTATVTLPSGGWSTARSYSSGGGGSPYYEWRCSTTTSNPNNFSRFSTLASFTTSGGTRTWTFNSAGNLQLPAGGSIVDSAGAAVIPVDISDLTDTTGLLGISMISGTVTMGYGAMGGIWEASRGSISVTPTGILDDIGYNPTGTGTIVYLTAGTVGDYTIDSNGINGNATLSVTIDGVTQTSSDLAVQGDTIIWLFVGNPFTLDNTNSHSVRMSPGSSISFNSLTDKPTLFSGNYSELSGKPTIPTNTNQLTNGAGFLVASDISGKQNTLVSGTNIRTVNSTSILGSGDIGITATSLLPSQVGNGGKLLATNGAGTLSWVSATTNYFKGLQILEDVYEASGAQNIIFSSADDSVTITRNANNIDFSASGGGGGSGLPSTASAQNSQVLAFDGYDPVWKYLTPSDLQVNNNSIGTQGEYDHFLVWDHNSTAWNIESSPVVCDRILGGSISYLKIGTSNSGVITASTNPGSIILTTQNNSSYNNSSYMSGFYVDPVRNDDTPAQMLYYNTTTKEITYGASSGGSSLPSQSGNSGKFLTTNGSTLSWATVSSGGGGGSGSGGEDPTAFSISSTPVGPLSGTDFPWTPPAKTGAMIAILASQTWTNIWTASSNGTTQKSPRAGSSISPPWASAWYGTVSGPQNATTQSEQSGGYGSYQCYSLDSSTNPATDEMAVGFMMANFDSTTGIISVSNAYSNLNWSPTTPGYLYGYITVNTQPGEAITGFTGEAGVTWKVDTEYNRVHVIVPPSVWAAGGGTGGPIGTLTGTFTPGNNYSSGLSGLIFGV